MNLRSREIFLLPNLITIFRLLLVLPIIYISFHYNNLKYPNYYLVFIIIIAFISDLADGIVARRKGLVSEMGKLLDPLADKILTLIIIVLFWVLGFVPLSYLLVLLFRDLIIFSGGIWLAKKLGTITPSNNFGKITVFSIGIFFLSTLLFGTISKFSQFMMYLSGFLSVLSILIYLYRGYKLLQNHGTIK